MSAACTDPECETAHILNPSTGQCVSTQSPLGRLLSRKELRGEREARAAPRKDPKDDVIGDFIKYQEEHSASLDSQIKTLATALDSGETRTSALIMQQLELLRAELTEVRAAAAANASIRDEIAAFRAQAEAAEASRVAREASPPAAPAAPVAPAAPLVAPPSPARSRAPKQSLNKAAAEVQAMKELVKRGVEPFSAEWRAILKTVKLKAEQGESVDFDV